MAKKGKKRTSGQKKPQAAGRPDGTARRPGTGVRSGGPGEREALQADARSGGQGVPQPDARPGGQGVPQPDARPGKREAPQADARPGGQGVPQAGGQSGGASALSGGQGVPQPDARSLGQGAPQEGGQSGGASALSGAKEGVARFSPLFNDAFLFLFGREAAKEMTLSLLNAVLDLAGLPAVGEVYSLTADAAMPGGVKCRTGRCDVVVMSDGAIYDIESQGRQANVANKALFYGAKIIAENAPRGGSGTYDDLPQAVMITLLHDRILLPESGRFVHVGQLDWDGAGGPATDRLVFVLVEMDKVARMYTIRSEEIWESESLAWLYLLARGYTDSGEMEALMRRFDTMIDFAEYYGIALGDPTLKRQYDKYIEVCMERNSEISAMRKEVEAEVAQKVEAEVRQAVAAEVRKEVEAEVRREVEGEVAQKAERDIKEGVERGIEQGRRLGVEQGIEEGREQGREQEREAIAGRMRELGIDEDTIARAIG